jgi:gamma-glutamyltranspeptidase/glutathione hydrolase
MLYYREKNDAEKRMLKRSIINFRSFISIICIIALLLFSRPINERADTRLPARGRSGMVCSTSDIATRVGVEILKRGGNAVDAAVAVALALAVTYPVAGNLGGGGFMLIRLADGKTIAIDYRETAPALATRTMFLDKNGKPIAGASTVGYLAAGVPGTVAGLALALEKYGTMKWSDLVEPARKLAAEGFPIGYRLSYLLKEGHDPLERLPRSGNVRELLEKFPDSRRIFLKDGKFYQEGEIFQQPELAETLQRLKEQGAREFYQGRTAQLIVDDMKAHGGLITLQDLKNYQPALREPLRGNYRGYEVITMPPPSSGGIALLEMLNILEHFDLNAMGDSSSEKYQATIETMRRAFADRAEFGGDADFVRVPVAGLISKRYAAEMAKTIDLKRATPSRQIDHGQPLAYESAETTHFCVVDAMGNAVSNTYTLNGVFGSGATVRGGGFLLNNEMDDFTTSPGLPNDYDLIQGQANSVAAHKRPLSSMTPTMLVKDGKLFMLVGSPGGPTIINTVLQVILNVVDHKMNIQQAVNAPRIHHQWLPDYVLYEPYGLARDVIDALKSRGQQFIDRPGYIGDAQAIIIDPDSGIRLGASDPRNLEGSAIGY